MRNVFVYGTLMFDEVWQQLSSRRYQKMDVVLADFIRLKVRGEEYPGIVPSSGNRVPGQLILDVTPDDIQQLDIFEGEYYQREQVNVLSGNKEYPADTYVFRKKYQSLLSTEEWDADIFKDDGLPSFLFRYGYFNH